MGETCVPKTDYSKIAKYFDSVRSKQIGVWSSKIIEYGMIDPNCTVLDIGCGTGRFSLTLAREQNPIMCALEPSIEMLKQAATKDKTRRILWILGDGQKLPFRDDFFNCVYMTLVIHHIENKEMALHEIYRVLKNGGNCVIMTNSHTRMKKSVLRHFPGITAIDLKRFPSVPSLKKIMIKIGFRNVHCYVVKGGEEDIPIHEYLARVRNKYVSTLTLLSEEAFQRGFKIFEQRVRRKYRTRIKRVRAFNFVVGQK